MALLKTTEDLGLTIRQRRRALGWDQAGLAERAGVSRQWIIDIEKGKPRAEMYLVLRVMNVLGLRLSADAPAAADSTPSKHKAPSINAVVASHRSSSHSNSPPAAGTWRETRSTGAAVDFGRILDEIQQGRTLVPGRTNNSSTRPTPLPPPSKRRK
ncbi:helix-turn-helix transcriptional regulator [uncultured Stenotrophomonas sp.]|uniref:helix-turn-helix transcriptional regulator n=1 Tax=uncultured Stenotrophomonas sp. TaxID=165438 RepID=UPI0025D1E61B|nr:helix-turn-helix transcriptional regulator [uncultured Stenotrophomonas sp.]